MEEAAQDSGPVADIVHPKKEHSTPERRVRPVFSGMSLLDRLIKTCPVWLQLCMSQEQVVEILKGEADGVFLVTRDVERKCMVLWVRYTMQDKTADVLRYNIKEEKTMMLLQGSVLMFEEIFKLIAFYCVSRDILPSTLKLPNVIARAQSSEDLEAISNLGTAFWDSSLREKRTLMVSHSGKFPSRGCSLRTSSVNSDQHVSQDDGKCTCEIEISAGNNSLWFVNPIFIEEFSNTETPDVLPLQNCIANTENKIPKVVYRRPPPPPPSHAALHSPPLPSIPPSAPPTNVTTSYPVSPLLPILADHSLSSNSVTDISIQCSSIEVTATPLSPSASCPLSPQKTCVISTSFSSQASPLPTTLTTKDLSPISKDICADLHLVGQSSSSMIINSVDDKKDDEGNNSGSSGAQTPCHSRLPPVVPSRRQSGKILEIANNFNQKKDKAQKEIQSPLKCQARIPIPESKTSAEVHGQPSPSQQDQVIGKTKKNAPPIPPPRTKKLSLKFDVIDPGSMKKAEKNGAPQCSRILEAVESCSVTEVDCLQRKDDCAKVVASQELKGSDTSLNSPVSGSSSQLLNADQDSYSTSSTEDDAERLSSPSIKKRQSFMLDKARNRLSIVAITNVFTAFMSADRKLQKRITELAQDKESYFGNLVQDYKAYTLEMMAQQSSSTEMLQEIRLMMTQLKSYLVQSTELKSMVDYTLYTDDKLDVIVEAALCKCVLKPLKAPIESYLREIHTKDGCLRLLKENQLVIEDTTTTDLGVTTSVPESSVMEKIIQKFGTMHKTYSPEKKITYLLKACKLIYDSMASGSPGKPHGADDFLPVLMYVLARCDLEALLIDVEYMMELMDPSLQLGEGSYYLTTTYGALEHIKNYDKITVTRQLSMEVQDSINRWERRRTLNKARVSRSSIQDFITISLEELDSKTATLVIKSDTSVSLVLQQCSEKFEVSEPQDYGLFVMVNDRCLRLAETSFPHQVKSHLLKHEQKLDFHFLYRITHKEDTVVKDLDFL
ncbi:ras and Rab interactor 3 [Pelobates cultripes]|uniref:Ras and Rab interactor 3 n=1 Tax=Pelobates cultripes TaxID=61616 RepID=A0AAD1TM81_PELCU|nr:ras and Rab interactor 3 [Pelobates cultripes]